MRNRTVIICISIGCVLVVIIASGMYLRRGVLIVVHNSGSSAMDGVKAELGGGRIFLGNTSSGSTASGRVVPRADSDVLIYFGDDDRKRHFVQLDVYVTGGYRGRVDAYINDGKLERKTENIKLRLLY